MSIPNYKYQFLIARYSVYLYVYNLPSKPKPIKQKLIIEKSQINLTTRLRVDTIDFFYFNLTKYVVNLK